MSWKHIATTEPAGAMSTRELTPDERQHVEDCLDAAAEWQSGGMPWEVAASVGAWHNSPARTRFLAITTTPRDDVRWHALQSLLNVLVDASGFVRTRQGIYSRRDLGESNTTIRVAPWEGIGT